MADEQIYDGFGSRHGPRFTVGKHKAVSCDWPTRGEPVNGVLVWDNHNGLALGQAFALVPDVATAERVVKALNALHSLGVEL